MGGTVGTSVKALTHYGVPKKEAGTQERNIEQLILSNGRKLDFPCQPARGQSPRVPPRDARCGYADRRDRPSRSRSGPQGDRGLAPRGTGRRAGSWAGRWPTWWPTRQRYWPRSTSRSAWLRGGPGEGPTRWPVRRVSRGPAPRSSLPGWPLPRRRARIPGRGGEGQRRRIRSGPRGRRCPSCLPRKALPRVEGRDARGNHRVVALAAAQHRPCRAHGRIR